MGVKRIQITTEEEALAILAEVERVSKIAPPKFYDPEFAKQTAFIRDRSIFKAAKCPRRAGKSRGVGMWLLEPVFEEANVSTLYIAKTRDSAKDIMWRDVLKEIDRDLGLGLKPNEQLLELRNPYNGSLLKLAGADAGPDELKKFLGRKIRRVAIDESADFRQDLESLVYEILYPAVADHEGEIALIGTTGQVLKGLFYEVTRPEKEKRRKGWSVHEWSSLDNPYMRDKILKQIAKLKEDNPRIEETPWYRRSYLNEWVADNSKLVYKYDPDRNDIHELPDMGGRLNVLGVDLGFSDASAFVVASFSPKSRHCDFVDGYKKAGMTITDVAERIQYFQRLYNPYAIVIDGAAKQSVEELRQRFALPLTTADKAGKAEIIEIMNADYIGGLVRLYKPKLAELADEYGDLIWDDKSQRREEHPACENHMSDAALYAWRHCLHYLHKPATKAPAKTAKQKVDEWEEREAERFENEKTIPFWERGIR